MSSSHATENNDPVIAGIGDLNRASEEEKVLGLDEEEAILHFQSNTGGKVYMLTESEYSVSGLLKTTFADSSPDEYTQESPFRVSKVSDEHMDILVRYMQTCASDGENEPPESPLRRDTLPNILGTDYEFFREIMESKESNKEKIAEISALIMDITYFDMVNFRKKACATMASIFIGKNMGEIKKMIDYVEEKAE